MHGGVLVGARGRASSAAVANLTLVSKELRGLIPACLFQNLTQLSVINLSNNSFSGPIRARTPPTTLKYINLGLNGINGTLPPWVFNPGILSFNAESNAVSGNTVVSVAHFIRVASNLISGPSAFPTVSYSVDISLGLNSVGRDSRVDRQRGHPREL